VQQAARQGGRGVGGNPHVARALVELFCRWRVFQLHQAVESEAVVACGSRASLEYPASSHVFFRQIDAPHLEVRAHVSDDVGQLERVAEELGKLREPVPGVTGSRRSPPRGAPPNRPRPACTIPVPRRSCSSSRQSPSRSPRSSREGFLGRKKSRTGPGGRGRDRMRGRSRVSRSISSRQKPALAPLLWEEPESTMSSISGNNVDGRKGSFLALGNSAKPGRNWSFLRRRGGSRRGHCRRERPMSGIQSHLVRAGRSGERVEAHLRILRRISRPPRARSGDLRGKEQPSLPGQRAALPRRALGCG